MVAHAKRGKPHRHVEENPQPDERRQAAEDAKAQHHLFGKARYRLPVRAQGQPADP